MTGSRQQLAKIDLSRKDFRMSRWMSQCMSEDRWNEIVRMASEWVPDGEQGKMEITCYNNIIMPH